MVAFFQLVYFYLDRYDRGNLVLTDFELKILNILRPRVAGEERFLVRRKSEILLSQAIHFLGERDISCGAS